VLCVQGVTKHASACDAFRALLARLRLPRKRSIAAEARVLESPGLIILAF